MATRTNSYPQIPEDHLYTTYFKKGGQKGVGEKPASSNGRQDSPARTKMEPIVSKTNGSNFTGGDKSNHRRFLDSHARQEDCSPRTKPNVVEGAVKGVGSESLRSSTLDPKIQGKIADKMGSPSPSGRSVSLTLSNRKSKLESSTGKASPRGATIPPISILDPDDPEGDKYTGKFIIAKNDRRESSPRVPSLEIDDMHNHHSSSKDEDCTCLGCPCFFNWCRK